MKTNRKMTTGSLKGQVALVTGASRGIGKGVAIELGKAGCTVYITGRDQTKSEGKLLHQKTSLEAVAEEINKNGGKSHAVFCDHSQPSDVKSLFERIEKQEGKLNILVNNAYAAVFYMLKNMGKKFYEVEDSPEHSYEVVNNVGLKNNYICAVYAAKIMARQKSGLIVNISSVGSINYLFNVPYGFGKCALNRMSADMAIELKDVNVNSISLVCGAVQTEVIGETILKNKENEAASYFVDGESIYFPGRAIAFLAQNEKILKEFNGCAVTTTQLMDKYGLKDVDGKAHRDKVIDKYAKHLENVNNVQLETLRK
ncbi:Dehydrogenase/reductase SDR family member 1 [Aphelenchoides besseyi]|nr:Dehydrogenase/reductase SDR family member 1 [Aphelenchoides besseyi]KAI6222184.1 Dehydrogenase/reductase SDR family member 1 [Aphelenchoides besseyi]